MIDEDIHELAALYAVDALDDDESSLFKSHLPQCVRCQRDVARYEEAIIMSLDVETIELIGRPGDEVRATILAAIAQTPQVPMEVAAAPAPAPVISLDQRRRPVRRALLAAAAAVVVVVGGAAVASQLSGQDPVDELAAVTDVETLELAGDTGSLTVVYSAERAEVALVGSGLDDPGEGKVYELWFVTDDGVSPAALFTPEDGSLRQIFSVADQPSTVGFGVTIEPDGGSDQPTGDILLVGTFEA